jgi:retron-type reverse transcriptase
MGLDGVREAARKGRDARFTALTHHITPELLAESFMELKRSAAAGIDGVTWCDHEDDLDTKIVALWDAVQSGRYRAQP